MQQQRNSGPRMERTRYPGIYKRGGSYVVVWRHRGKQHKEFFPTLAEAREAKGRRQSGDRRPQARVSFDDYFEKWIATYAGRTQRGFSETTRVEYRRPIEQHALPVWARWNLSDVEPGDVRELFGDLRSKGTSTQNIKKLRAALSVLFATALEDDLVKTNPVRGVRIPQAIDDLDVGDEKPKALTRSELGILLAAAPDDWRLFFEFLAHTGLRISEAVGLTWSHLELGDAARVRVVEQVYRGERKRLKSAHARREIPLSSGMKQRLLERRRDAFKGPDSPVFGTTLGQVHNPSNVRGRVLLPMTKAAGFGETVEVEVKGKKKQQWRTWVTFHTFRHTCASLLFEAGKDVKQVQEWLGHSDPGFTLRTYVHLMDEGLGDADFLDDVVGDTTDPARLCPAVP